MQTAKLSNWSLILHGKENEVQLQGIVEGHPRLVNGLLITTSLVKEINVPENFAITMNTKYELKEPHEKFKKIWNFQKTLSSSLEELQKTFIEG
jgi:hypothetical protein